MRGNIVACLWASLLISACSAPGGVGETIKNESLRIPSIRSVQPEMVSDLILQRLNTERGSRQLTKDAQQTQWYQIQKVNTPSLDMILEDVRLKQTQESIVSNTGLAALQPDYAGAQIRLVLQGHFQKTKKQPLSLADFAYQYEWPLLHQTFLSQRPQAKVLLDQSLLLEVVAVSESEIEAILHTQAVPDLYLKGPHQLSITYGEQTSTQWIEIGDPIPPTESLYPQIESVEVLSDVSEPVVKYPP